MTPLLQADRGQPAHDIHIVDADSFDVWLSGQNAGTRAALRAQGLKPVGYAHAILPGSGDDDWSVVTVVANRQSLSSWCLATLAADLPAGVYRLADAMQPGPAMFGWITAQYRFDRYLARGAKAPCVLLTSEVAQMERIVSEAAAESLARDLINTPAGDMGPAEIESAARALAAPCDASVEVTQGDALERAFPLLAAVGGAAPRARSPRMIEMMWGHPDHPRVALIGKGVCFDSGGLDIKPSAGMRLMKKDMGGAATVIALAQLIMAARLPVRLHLLIPAVENAISGTAMRPGDVIRSRQGMTVEIGNTDAEGRLVLADALTKASEGDPGLIVDVATLTGAARTALGPDLPALFANDDALAEAILKSGRNNDDPCWQLPLHEPYLEFLNSDIADLDNSGSSPFAGAITGALFLGKFAGKAVPWAHIDSFAWRPVSKPGRPRGGAGLGMRALWGALRERYA